MHAVIIEDLEEYLAGTLSQASERRVRAHVEKCGECRQELQEIRDLTELLPCLKAEEAIEPPPGFVAKIMLDAAAAPPASFWSPFADFAYGRRVVFASLLTLAVLGTVLVSREMEYAPAPTTPEAVMANDQVSPTADRMLVTLASYEP
jgi:predicted anti-sigma-YlaC factor YlaD